MFDLLHNILSDKKGGTVFECFGVWHLCYVMLFAAIAFFACRYMRKKDETGKKRTSRLFIDIAFGIYLSDMFLYPLAFGEIDIENLPFHACTAMCVMSFLSFRVRSLEKYRYSFALLGFVSNLVYLIYPAGVMWYAVHPLSYRVIETLFFHGFMTVYGLMVLLGGESKKLSAVFREIPIIASMTLWAVLGNLVYNNDERVYNWFFVVSDPFGMFPEQYARLIMPFLNIVLFFVAEFLIVCLIRFLKRFMRAETSNA